MSELNIICLTLLGVAFFEAIAAVFLYRRSKDFVQHSNVVSARITALGKVEEGAQWVDISFKDELNRVVNTSIRISGKNAQVNDEVEIRSHKNEPEKVKLNSFIYLWLLPAAFAGQVVVMLVVSLMLYITQ